MNCTFFRKPLPIHALSEWLAACEQRIDPASPLATRRREDRFDSYRELTFRVADNERIVSGIALNISQSGLCLKVPVRLRRSDVLHLEACHFTPCREASVRWVRPLGDACYMAGLQCLTRDQVRTSSVI